MHMDFDPYVRFVAKTTYFIRRREIVARDARLLFVLSGFGTFTSEGATYRLSPYTLVVYPYNVPYRIDSDTENGMLFYTVNFDFTQEFSHYPTTVPKSIQDHDPKDCFYSMSKELEEFFGKVLCIHNAFWAEQDMEELYAEALNQEEGYREIQSLNVKRILIRTYRSIRSDTTHNPLCRRVKEEVSQDLKVKIKDIAAKLGYHPFYLNEVFKKEEGITLHSYITTQRLKKAYELLTATQHSLDEIALLCGFSSQAHLTSAFRTAYRITPGALRRQM